MSLAFLTPAPAVPAVSPLHAELAAAGATFELRDGWRVATRVAGERAGAAVRWADLSDVAKYELHAPADAPTGTARRDGDAWWCPVTPERALVLGEAAQRASLRAELEERAPGQVLDVTTQYGALLLAGPAARETIARFCALDLRAGVAPPGAFRPGSVARTPGAVLVEAPDRLLLLFGAAVASYLWTVVSDAGAHLGGCAVGVDAVREEALARA